MDEDGEVVVEYVYSDWGELFLISGSLAETIGEVNPFRYRGYVYDEETGLYYVSSRYYDPEVGRFINADEIDYLGADGSLTGFNLFAYCNNNPINKADEFGCSPFGVLQLNDYWIIHKIIQMLCCAEFGLSMEVYVKGRLGVGFLDLYDLSTHQYYEVKSSRAAKRFHTQTQMVKYDNSLIQDKRFEKVEAICDSSPRRGAEMITGSFAYGIYDVTFGKTQDGLIEYSVELNSQRTLAEALVLVGLLCYATGNVPGGAVANAYAVALF